MKLLLPIFLVFLFQLGCQQKPTKVVAQETAITENVLAENLLKDKAVILDVRSPFEFNISHVPGAVNVQWEDFSPSNSKYRGLLEKDLFAVARRLSLIGIDPDTKVVVLGKAAQGQGEEGRVAWTLNVLGVQKVYTLHYKFFRQQNVTKEAPPVENKPYWKPQVQESLLSSLKDFQNQIKKPDAETVILDVRSAQEFALPNSLLKNSKIAIKNIEWKEFFSDKGLPDLNKVIQKLSADGISKATRVIVISNHGVRSAAVVYALNYLGYGKASNFAGGYEQYK
ncbi:MAG: sulfurtransferase [Bdellovibrio sp.]